MKRRRKKRQAPVKNRVLDWKRAKRADLTHSQRKVWESRCGRYRIERIEILLALDTNPYPPYYLALGEGKTPSRHRNRKAAEDECERHIQSRSQRRM